MSVKEELLNNLFNLLRREDGLLGGLAAAARDQTVALKDNSLEAIRASVRRLNAIVAEMDELEKERLAVQEALERELGLAPGSALTDVIASTRGGEREKLAFFLDSMRGKARLLREANHINAAMNRQAMAFNRVVLKAIDPAIAGFTYGSRGAIERGAAVNPLFSKTV